MKAWLFIRPVRSVHKFFWVAQNNKVKKVRNNRIFPNFPSPFHKFSTRFKLNFIHKLHLWYLLKQKICEKAAAQRKTGKQTVANSKPPDKKVWTLTQSFKIQSKGTVVSPAVRYVYYFNVKAAEMQIWAGIDLKCQKIYFFDTELFICNICFTSFINIKQVN